MIPMFELIENPSRHNTSFRRLSEVYKMSPTLYRRLIDVETTSCVYCDQSHFQINKIIKRERKETNKTKKKQQKRKIENKSSTCHLHPFRANVSVHVFQFLLVFCRK